MHPLTVQVFAVLQPPLSPDWRLPQRDEKSLLCPYKYINMEPVNLYLDHKVQPIYLSHNLKAHPTLFQQTIFLPCYR
jgi:hypothetical protein